MKKLFKILITIIIIPIIFIYSSVILAQLVLIKEYGRHFTTIETTTFLNSKITFIDFWGDLLCIGILFLIFLTTNDGLIKRCKFKKFSTKKLPVILSLTIGLTFITVTIVGLIQKFINVTSYTSIVNDFSSVHSSIIYFLICIIACPIMEEIVFRGCIFSVLKRNMNIVIALIIQALIFAIVHENIVQSSYVFFLGLVLGFVFIYAGSLLGNIICHITFNLFGMVLLPLLASLYYNPIIYIIIGVILIIFSLYLYKKEQKNIIKILV